MDNKSVNPLITFIFNNYNSNSVVKCSEIETLLATGTNGEGGNSEFLNSPSSTRNPACLYYK